MKSSWTKAQKEAVKKWREFSKMLKQVVKKYGNDSAEADAFRETYTFKDWFGLPEDERKRLNKDVQFPKLP